MKITKRLLFIIMIGILLIPFVVNASTSIYVDTQRPVVGTTLYVQIGLNYGDDKFISDAHYNVKYDPEYLRFDEVVWTQSRGTYSSEPGIVRIDKTSSTSAWASGGPVVLKMQVIKAGKSDVNISESGVALYSDGSSVAQTFSGITISSVNPSDNTMVGTLYVDNYVISPTFQKSKYNYTLAVPPETSTINIVATKGAETQTITGDGQHNLQYGKNKIQVKVEAQNGDTAIYEIMVTRQDDRTGDVTLKKLTVSNTDISIVEGQTEYNATVSRSIDNVFITARTNDVNAQLTGTGKKNIEIGMNTFEIKVIGSNDKYQIYTINILRSTEEFQKDEVTSELLNLNINNLAIDLSKGKTFLVGVDSNTNELSINAVPKSKTAEVTIEKNSGLKTGINEIIIKVKEKKNEEETIYKVLAYKQPAKSTKYQSLNSNFSDDKDVFFESLETEKHFIPLKAFDSLGNKRLYYNVTNIYGGVIYQVILNRNSFNSDVELELNQIENLKYKTNLPAGVEVLLFVGDEYSGSSLRAYSNKEGEEYKILTESIRVENGYMTFTTNGDAYYTFTTDYLLGEDNTLINKIKANIDKIAIAAGAIILIIIVLRLISKSAKNKEKKELTY